MDIARKACLAFLLGGLAAAAVELFHQILLSVEWLIYGVRSGHLVAIAGSITPVHRLLLPSCGGLLAGLTLWAFQCHARRCLWRPVLATDYLEAVRADNGRLDMLGSLSKILASVCVVVTGSAIGREGAMILLAALVAGLCTRRMPDGKARKLWVACGIAGGVAGAYHAPLAGGLFIAEIFWGSFALRAIWPVFIASAASWGVTLLLTGHYAPLYHLPALPGFTWAQLLPFASLGLLAGLLGAVYLKMLAVAGRIFKAARLPSPLCLVCGGLAIGGLSLVHPEVWGNGYSVIQNTLTAPQAVTALAALLLFKFAAIACSSGSGAPGGIFTPTLCLGALLGALAGSLLNIWMPGANAGLAPGLALAGMAALLSAVTHAPAMSAVIACELTGGYYLLPLLYPLALLACLAAKHARGGTIYDSR